MADVERERVTALWREAARALEPGLSISEQERLLSHRAPCAECGRLREQLDAATGLAKAILDFTKNEALEEWDGGSVGYSLGGICSMADDFLAARAALGVEGEQE